MLNHLLVKQEGGLIVKSLVTIVIVCLPQKVKRKNLLAGVNKVAIMTFRHWSTSAQNQLE